MAGLPEGFVLEPDPIKGPPEHKLPHGFKLEEPAPERGMLNDYGRIALRGVAEPFASAAEGLGRLTYETGKYLPDWMTAPLNGGPRPTSAAQDPFSRAGKAIEGVLPDVNQDRASSVPGRIVSGVTGLAGQLPLFMAGPAGMAAAIGNMALSGGEQQAKEAEAMGATPDQVNTAGLAGGALNAGLGLIPVGRAINRIGAGQGIASVAGKGAIENALIGGAIKAGSNLTASDVAGYDPARPTMQDVAEEAGIQGAVGGLTLGGLRAVTGKPKAPANAEIVPAEPSPNALPGEPTVQLKALPKPEIVPGEGFVMGGNEAMAQRSTLANDGVPILTPDEIIPPGAQRPAPEVPLLPPVDAGKRQFATRNEAGEIVGEGFTARDRNPIDNLVDHVESLPEGQRVTYPQVREILGLEPGDVLNAKAALEALADWRVGLLEKRGEAFYAPLPEGRPIPTEDRVSEPQRLSQAVKELGGIEINPKEGYLGEIERVRAERGGKSLFKKEMGVYDQPDPEQTLSKIAMKLRDDGWLQPDEGPAELLMKLGDDLGRRPVYNDVRDTDKIQRFTENKAYEAERQRTAALIGEVDREIPADAPKWVRDEARKQMLENGHSAIDAAEIAIERWAISEPLPTKAARYDEDIPFQKPDQYRVAESGDRNAPGRAELLSDLKSTLRQTFGDNLNMGIVDRIPIPGGGEAHGAMFSRKMPDGGIEYWAKIAMSSPDAIHSLNHEGVHYLKAVDAFTPREWRALDAAADKWIDRFNIRQRYKGMPDANMREEAIAEAYASYARGDKGFTKPQADAFEKIKQFIERVGNLLRDRGFQTADDVLKRIQSGKVGERADNPVAKNRAVDAIWYQKPDLSAQDKALHERIFAKTDRDLSLPERLQKRLGEIVQNFKSEFRQGALDQFDAIRKIETGGTLRDSDLKKAEQSAWKAALASKNLSSVMDVLLNHGMIEYRGDVLNGEARLRGYDEKTNTVNHGEFAGGLTGIFKPLAKDGKLEQWKLWAVAKRAERLKSEGRENLLTDADIADGLAIGARPENVAQFNAVMDKWQSYNKGILDFAERAGVVSKDQRKLFEKDDYIPFLRIDAEGEAKGGGTKGGRGLANQGGVKTLRGGKDKLADPIESMVAVTSRMVDSAMKNIAARRALDMAEKAGIVEKRPSVDFRPERINAEAAAEALENIGVQVSGLTLAQKTAMIEIFMPQPPKDVSAVFARVDGKPQYYRVDDPLLLRSLAAMQPENIGQVTKILAASKNLFTRMVTMDPGFMAANSMRDAMSVKMLTGKDADMKFGAAPIMNAIKAFKRDPSTLAMMAAGGGGGQYWHPEAVTKKVEREFGADAKNAILDTPKKMLDFLDRVGNASEQMNRRVVYDAAIKAGDTPAEAAFKARDLMDFQMKGDFGAMRFLTMTVPFMNARIQGLYKLYRAGTSGADGERVGRINKSVLAHGGLLTFGSLALLAANWDKKEYQDLPEWDKDTYYHFFVGDQHFRLPKPFEMGAIFSTIPERLTENILGGATNKETAKRILSVFGDQLSMNPTPQLFGPIIEQVANKSFFRNTAIDNPIDEKLRPAERYDYRTSSTMKAIADGLDAAGLGVSPKRLEHLVNGYFGTMGMYALSAADAVTRNVDGSAPRAAKRIEDYPVVGRFIRDNPAMGTKWLQEFYDAKHEADQVFASVQKLRNEGEVQKAMSLASGEKVKLGFRPALENIQNQLGRIRKAQTEVNNSRVLTPEAKRARLDQLIDQRNKIVAQYEPLKARMRSLSEQGAKP